MSNEFDWASTSESEEKKVTFPFGTEETVEDFDKEELNEEIAEKAGLPVIKFAFPYEGVEYRVTTDDPLLSDNNFHSPAEVDEAVLKLDAFSITIATAYGTARKNKKLWVRKKEEWEAIERTKIIEESTKKPSIREVDDILISTNTDKWREFKQNIDHFEYEEDRLDALYKSIVNRSFFLSKMALRFSDDPESYRTVFVEK